MISTWEIFALVLLGHAWFGEGFLHVAPGQTLKGAMPPPNITLKTPRQTTTLRSGQLSMMQYGDFRLQENFGELVGVKSLASAQEFKDVIANTGEQLVVVKFYANSCRLCKQLDFHYKKLPEEYPGVLFCEISNIGNEALFCNEAIDSLPTLCFFRGPSMMIDKMRYKFSNIEELKQKISSLSYSYSIGAESVPESVPLRNL